MFQTTNQNQGLTLPALIGSFEMQTPVKRSLAPREEAPKRSSGVRSKSCEMTPARWCPPSEKLVGSYQIYLYL